MPPDGSTQVRILCPECGDIVEVQDVAEIVRALHLTNECSVRTLITPQQ